MSNTDTTQAAEIKTEKNGKAKAEAEAVKPKVEETVPTPQTNEQQMPDELPIIGGQLVTNGFVPNDRPIGEGWARVPNNFLIYDMKYAAPHGALVGKLIAIEEYVVEGNTISVLIVKPTLPCAAVARTAQGLMLTRATPAAFVMVELPGRPEALNRLKSPTHYYLIDVRPGDMGNWIIHFDTQNRFPKGME